MKRASAAFNVMPGTPTHLGFVQQPTNAVAGAAISPAVTVQLLDANNNTVTTDSTDAVTMAIGANPTARQGWAAFRGMLPLTEAEFKTIAQNVAPYMR